MYVYSLVADGEESNITVFPSGEAPLIAHSTHPNFHEIIRVVTTGEEANLRDLFDLSAPLARSYDHLTERVSIANGRIYFDGDEVNNTLTNHILRCHRDGVEDIRPIVRFMDKVMDNPSEHSREMLFDWLRASEFTLTEDGNILGYKGVRVTQDEGIYTSISSGSATVDGKAYNGKIPNHIGAVVEMPRSVVEHDPASGCSTGLHVGTYDYANGFAQGALLECHVNPRDVVSVPTDCGAQKMRCCRYKVVNVLEQKVEVPIAAGYGDYDPEDEDDGEYEY